MARVVLLLTLAVRTSNAHTAVNCPTALDRHSHTVKPGSPRVAVLFRSNISDYAALARLDESGGEHDLVHIAPGSSHEEQTFAGHVFRFYVGAKRELVLEYEVSQAQKVVIHACGSLQPYNASAPIQTTTERLDFVQYPRVENMSHLVLPPDQPCLPEGRSSQWSCTRVLTMEDVLARDPELFGFPSGQNDDPQADHGIVDTHSFEHVRHIPKVTPSGPGFLRMRFTSRLQKVLKWWSQVDLNMSEREPVMGGYTNANHVEMSYLSLRNSKVMEDLIYSEMKKVLEWWTGLPLTHSAIYGVRTYHRGSVLVDHVDRGNHIVSAVLQVSQTVDDDGGWPLEVMLNEGSVGEVYLQPGEMVLYEGAWLAHGRPMRFRGENFSNIFVFFRPTDWDDTMSKGSQRYYGAPYDRWDTLKERGITSSDRFIGPKRREL